MDFRYIIQDLSNYYIGARMTYEELTGHEDMPGRLRSAIFRYIEDETDLSVMLCEHLLSMDKKSKSAFIFEQLKCEITILPDKEKGRMKQTIMKAEEFFSSPLRDTLTCNDLSEIRFKKKNLIFLRV